MSLQSAFSCLTRRSFRCLQHPYLFSEDIEPSGLSPSETHEKLIDARYGPSLSCLLKIFSQRKISTSEKHAS